MAYVILLGLLVALYFMLWPASTVESAPTEGAQARPKPDANTAPISIEYLLRGDPRVQRLLSNRRWAGAAQAAIAFCVKGTGCPSSPWRRSSTWSQVEMVHRELRARYPKLTRRDDQFQI